MKNMNKPDTEYIENLQYFLQNSDEDEADSNMFLSRLNHYLNRSLNKLDWLDVGAGPGTKPINILRGGLSQETGLLDRFDQINFDVVEPSKAWTRILIDNFKEGSLDDCLQNIYQTTWEGFDREAEYDLITFFHSVYGIKTESLKKIPGYLSEDSVACIAVENNDSDLYRIKESLFPHIHHQELKSSTDMIKNFFDEKDMDYTVDYTNFGQRFYVDEILESGPNSSKVLAFILQTKPDDHDKIIDPGLQNKIENELQKYVKEDESGNHYINTPDSFIWIESTS